MRINILQYYIKNLLKREIILTKEFRNILNFILSDLFSGFGAWVSFIGINWYLLEKTNLSSVVGLQMSVYTIASLIISPFSGVIIDKYNRKKIIIISNFVRAFTIIIVALFLWFDFFNLYLFLLLSIINGMGFTLYTGSSRALVQQITNASNVSKTNSLLEVSLQVGSFVAAGLSGIIYYRFGIISILAINAICFLISNLLLTYVYLDKLAAVTINQKKWLESIKEGFAYLGRNYNIALIGASLYIPLIIGSSLNVLLPAYISKILNENTITYGIVHMSYGIGAVASGLLFGLIISKLSGSNILSIVLFMASALTMIFFSMITSTLLVIALMFIFGILNTIIRIILNTVIMEKVDKAIMGRVMTSLLLITRLIQVLILYLIGVVIDNLPINIGFITLAVVSFLGAIGLWFAFKKTSKPIKQDLLEYNQ